MALPPSVLHWWTVQLAALMGVHGADTQMLLSPVYDSWGEESLLPEAVAF